jgi:hypothetical protein
MSLVLPYTFAYENVIASTEFMRFERWLLLEKQLPHPERLLSTCKVDMVMNIPYIFPDKKDETTSDVYLYLYIMRISIVVNMFSCFSHFSNFEEFKIF